jgi:hypothetical protein
MVVSLSGVCVGHYGMGMTAAASPATAQLETLRGLVRTATQRLLGDTILVSEDKWACAQPAAGLDSRPRRYPHSRGTPTAYAGWPSGP